MGKRYLIFDLETHLYLKKFNKESPSQSTWAFFHPLDEFHENEIKMFKTEAAAKKVGRLILSDRIKDGEVPGELVVQEAAVIVKRTNLNSLLTLPVVK